MASPEDLARADLLIAHGERHVEQMRIRLQRAGARDRLSVQVFGTMRDSLQLMVEYRERLRRELKASRRPDWPSPIAPNRYPSRSPGRGVGIPLQARRRDRPQIPS